MVCKDYSLVFLYQNIFPVRKNNDASAGPTTPKPSGYSELNAVRNPSLRILLPQPPCRALPSRAGRGGASKKKRRADEPALIAARAEAIRRVNSGAIWPARPRAVRAVRAATALIMRSPRVARVAPRRVASPCARPAPPRLFALSISPGRGARAGCGGAAQRATPGSATQRRDAEPSPAVRCARQRPGARASLAT